MKKTNKKVIVTRDIGFSNTKKKYNEFQMWFADCILYCVNNKNEMWDGYNWSLKHCEVWKNYFKLGLQSNDAVEKHFRLN